MHPAWTRRCRVGVRMGILALDSRRILWLPQVAVLRPWVCALAAEVTLFAITIPNCHTAAQTYYLRLPIHKWGNSLPTRWRLRTKKRGDNARVWDDLWRPAWSRAMRP